MSDFLLVIDRRDTVVTLNGGALESVYMGSVLGASIAVRVAQHRLVQSGSVAVAQDLVLAKVQGYRLLLAQLPDGEGVRESLRQRLDSVPSAEGCSTLMGIEGACGALWWGWLATHLPACWLFSGRNRRPPRDPVNALLSLSYTLLESEVLAEIQRQGFDPALGFLHGIVPGRSSLVFDLMEPLRAGVDAFVLSLLDEVLLPSHFSGVGEGCRLDKEGRALFYRAWAKARTAWPLLPFGMECGDEASLMRCCGFVAKGVRHSLGRYSPSTGEKICG
ncbi:MAG: CRISPR-associated endonuclease Cas1 [Gammaproteobacteria bacterium]|nr:CRISPR-associated endonuclease Cas1 [Gammaproteobacteria bacterium]